MRRKEEEELLALSLECSLLLGCLRHLSTKIGLFATPIDTKICEIKKRLDQPHRRKLSDTVIVGARNWCVERCMLPLCVHETPNDFIRIQSKFLAPFLIEEAFPSRSSNITKYEIQIRVFVIYLIKKKLTNWINRKHYNTYIYLKKMSIYAHRQDPRRRRASPGAAFARSAGHARVDAVRGVVIVVIVAVRCSSTVWAGSGWWRRPSCPPVQLSEKKRYTQVSGKENIIRLSSSDVLFMHHF